jgi:glycosyltransferase involved in cell wall biosynthesis
MMDLIRSSREMDRKFFFYMILPEWAQDPWPDEPNQFTITVPMNKDFWMNEMIGVPAEPLAEAFCRRGGKYIVDMLYTEMVRPSWYMGQVISDYRSRHSLPVFITDPITIGGWVNRTWEHRVANAYSYLHGYPLATSTFEENGYRELVTDFFRPAYIDKFNQRIHRVPVAIDIASYQKVRDEEQGNKHEKVSLFCGMRFNEDKGIKFIMDVFRTLYASGRDIYVCSTTGTDQIKGTQQIPDKDMSMLKTMKFGCPRDEYVQEAARCHVFLSASKVESFAMHIVEQLTLGLIGVLPNAQWVWDWIPKEYPFVYEPGDRVEAYTMISWVMDNYERAYEMARPFMDYVAKAYDSKESSKAIFDAFNQRIDERFVDYTKKPLRFSKGGKFRYPFRLEVCDAADSLGESFSMPQLLQVLKARMKGTDVGVFTKLGGPRLGVPTLYDIRMMLESYGWTDACDGPKVRFVRGDNVIVPSHAYADQIAAAKAGKIAHAAEAAADEEEDLDV